MPKRRNDDYDSYKDDYRDDYSDTDAEYNGYDKDYYDDSDDKYTEKDDVDSTEAEDANDDWSEDDAGDENIDYAALGFPNEKHFDKSKFDFVKIMENYRSGDFEKKKAAVSEACYAMDALVKYIVKKNYPTYQAQHYDDLLQEGRLAVVDALDGYYPERCAPSSYFYTAIKHNIQVFIAEHVHKTTRHYAAMANKIRKAEAALAQIDGLSYHDDITISTYTGIPLTTVIETRKQTTAANFVELSSQADTPAEDVYTNPQAAYVQAERNNALYKALGELTDTEMKILMMTYGLGEYDAMSVAAISRDLGMKPDAVRRTTQDALRKLSQNKFLRNVIGDSSPLDREKKQSDANVAFTGVSFGEGKDFFAEEEENSEVSLEEFFKLGSSDKKES